MNKVQREFILSLDRDGHIDPEDVLAAAEPEDSPIHKLFTWDDSVAAARFRLDEARVVIRRVQVNYIPGEKTVRQIRVKEYIHDPDLAHGQRGYVRSALLRTREESALSALAAELKAIAALVARTRMMAAHLGLSKECEVGLKEVIKAPPKAKAG